VSEEHNSSQESAVWIWYWYCRLRFAGRLQNKPILPTLSPTQWDPGVREVEMGEALHPLSLKWRCMMARPFHISSISVKEELQQMEQLGH
jgi:hypothetical protein